VERAQLFSKESFRPDGRTKGKTNADDDSESEHSETSGVEEIRDILVVGFTREVAYQFVRIRQRKEGDVYIENRYRPSGPHFSYHASGKMHSVYVNQQGKTIHSSIGQGPPIARFRGEVSLGAWVIYAPNLPVWKQFAPSKDSKAQLVIRFDMSRLSGELGLNFWLFESGRKDLLETFLENLIKMDVKVVGYVLITDTNPWILIVAMTV
jgi:hypothetical protein